MPICEYQNPLRTVRFGYELEQDVIRLISYTEDDAVTAPKDSDADVVVIHGANIIHHSYPVFTDNGERRTFELNEFLQELEVNRDRVVVIPSGDSSEGTAWSTILGIIRAPANVLTDVECLLAVSRIDSPAVYIGFTGKAWWLSESTDSIRQLSCLAASTATDETDDAVAIVQNVLEDYSFEARRLVVYGDAVTPGLLKELQKRFLSSFDIVERFQPFRFIRSNVPMDVGQRILSRAHILGCAVGAMLIQQGIVINPASHIEES